MHPATQALMDQVHRHTGYPVTTDVAEDITDHARMISAQPETPFHLVQVNAKHRAKAPYIVAAQCASRQFRAMARCGYSACSFVILVSL